MRSAARRRREHAAADRRRADVRGLGAVASLSCGAPMTYTRAIAEHHMRCIRARLVCGCSDAEREAGLAEQATYYRRQPDLFAQRSPRIDPRGTSRSPGLRCCDSLESGAIDGNAHIA